MNKAELVDLVASGARLERGQAAAAVDAAIAAIEHELAGGGEVALTGFGRFHVAQRVARRGVNPRTGEAMTIAATTIPRFTAGSSLKKAVRS